MLNQFLHALTYHTRCNMTAKVADVIEDEQWQIPDSVKIAVPDLANLFEEQQIGGGGDEWVWTISINGEYSVKAAYGAIRNTKPVARWANTVWFTGNIPKHSFIAWLAI